MEINVSFCTETLLKKGDIIEISSLGLDKPTRYLCVKEDSPEYTFIPYRKSKLVSYVYHYWEVTYRFLKSHTVDRLIYVYYNLKYLLFRRKYKKELKNFLGTLIEKRVFENRLN